MHERVTINVYIIINLWIFGKCIYCWFTGLYFRHCKNYWIPWIHWDETEKTVWNIRLPTIIWAMTKYTCRLFSKIRWPENQHSFLIWLYGTYCIFYSWKGTRKVCRSQRSKQRPDNTMIKRTRGSPPGYSICAQLIIVSMWSYVNA